MNNEQKLIALAKLDGVKPDEWFCVECNKAVPSEHVTNNETHDVRFGGCGNFCNGTAPYLTNGDEIRRLIGKQIHAPHKQVEFCKHLKNTLPYLSPHEFHFITATPEQLADALLKATGNWVD